MCACVCVCVFVCFRVCACECWNKEYIHTLIHMHVHTAQIEKWFTINPIFPTQSFPLWRGKLICSSISHVQICASFLDCLGKKIVFNGVCGPGHWPQLMLLSSVAELCPTSGDRKHCKICHVSCSSLLMMTYLGKHRTYFSYFLSSSV